MHIVIEMEFMWLLDYLPFVESCVPFCLEGSLGLLNGERQK